MASDNSLSFPPDLMARIEAAARAANKTPEEWAGDAVRRQLTEKRWQDLLTRNERQARSRGLKESDVPSLVAENRRERRRRAN